MNLVKTILLSSIRETDLINETLETYSLVLAKKKHNSLSLFNPSKPNIE